jgi:hypothetical protein
MLERSLEASNNLLIQFDDALIWFNKFREVEGVKRSAGVRAAVTRDFRQMLVGDYTGFSQFPNLWSSSIFKWVCARLRRSIFNGDTESSNLDRC